MGDSSPKPQTSVVPSRNLISGVSDTANDATSPGLHGESSTARSTLYPAKDNPASKAVSHFRHLSSKSKRRGKSRKGKKIMLPPEGNYGSKSESHEKPPKGKDTTCLSKRSFASASTAAFPVNPSTDMSTSYARCRQVKSTAPASTSKNERKAASQKCEKETRPSIGSVFNRAADVNNGVRFNTSDLMFHDVFIQRPVAETSEDSFTSERSSDALLYRGKRNMLPCNTPDAEFKSAAEKSWVGPSGSNTTPDEDNMVSPFTLNALVHNDDVKKSGGEVDDGWTSVLRARPFQEKGNMPAAHCTDNDLGISNRTESRSTANTPWLEPLEYEQSAFNTAVDAGNEDIVSTSTLDTLPFDSLPPIYRKSDVEEGHAFPKERPMVPYTLDGVMTEQSCGHPDEDILLAWSPADIDVNTVLGSNSRNSARSRHSMYAKSRHPQKLKWTSQNGNRTEKSDEYDFSTCLSPIRNREIASEDRPLTDDNNQRPSTRRAHLKGSGENYRRNANQDNCLLQ